MKSGTTESASAAKRRERWARNGRFSFTIELLTIECRCGTWRARTAACPDCGARPGRHDVDVGLQRRKRLAARAIEALRSEWTADPSETMLTVPEAFDHLADAVWPFLEALQKFVAREVDDGSDVIAACEAVARLRGQLTASVAPRPWIYSQGEAAEIAEGLIETFEIYLHATSASTAVEAQDLGRKAQARLDHLADSGSRVAGEIGRMLAVSESADVAEILETVAADAYLALGAGSLLEVERAASARLAGVLGREPGVGQGIAYMHHELWVGVLGDRSRFRLALQRLDSLIEGRSKQFQNLVERPEVLAELQVGMLQLADQLQQTMATLAITRNNRQQVRAVVQLMHAMYEGPARRFAAVALDLVGKGKFDDLAHKDGAHVIDLARADRRFRDAFYGFEKSFRVAYAHLDFASEEGAIAVYRGPGVRDLWTEDEVLDSLLAAMECTAALGLILSMRAQDLGVEVDSPVSLEAVGIDEDRLASLMLAWAGCTQIESLGEPSNPRLRFGAERLTLGTVALITRGYPGAAIARLEVFGPDGVVDLWCLDVAGFRAFNDIPEEDALSRECELLLALWNSTKNGHRVRSSEVLAHWAAHKTVALLRPEGSPIASMRDMTRLMRFSTKIGQPELGAAINKVKGFYRLAMLGLADDNDKASVLTINRFLLDAEPKLEDLVS